MALVPKFAELLSDPKVSQLNLSSLTNDDLINLILQRSEVLYDQPKGGKVIKAWQNGKNRPIQAEVSRLGVEIARRAAARVYGEYQSLADTLKSIAPKRIADIGCGYAFFDLFAARDLAATVLLIDLEANEHRHFGFQTEGAAYSSLAVARQLLEDNGVERNAIETLNPRDQPPETAAPVDLVVSFLSCGFHYPVDSYLPFIDKALVSGGVAIFDLRMDTAAVQSAQLETFGTLTDLASPQKEKVRRVLLKKN
ncbi:MAG: class I SAM-dependent methyltransferase [Rhodobacteraceae bacterium]|nr:class I SAM-dependent methyltransferase [Paracoccaceae bacterium]